MTSEHEDGLKARFAAFLMSASERIAELEAAVERPAAPSPRREEPARAPDEDIVREYRPGAGRWRAKRY